MWVSQKDPGKSYCAVILAAGLGSRLAPLSYDQPKCLINVGNKPILHSCLAGLQSLGVDEIIIAVGYKDGLIRQYATTHFPQLSVSYVMNRRFEFSGSI